MRLIGESFEAYAASLATFNKSKLNFANINTIINSAISKDINRNSPVPSRENDEVMSGTHCTTNSINDTITITNAHNHEVPLVTTSYFPTGDWRAFQS